MRLFNAAEHSGTPRTGHAQQTALHPSDRKLVETTADDLRAVLSAGGTSTNHFLRCLHNLAVGMELVASVCHSPETLAGRHSKAEARHPARRATKKIIAAEKTQSAAIIIKCSGKLGGRSN
ncbi:MAG: hypothetical protein IPK15_21955 [Verrucomicrobia bacterium]|nr:hypothetical protein [Verrucomicrobiota bacterium]